MKTKPTILEGAIVGFLVGLAIVIAGYYIGNLIHGDKATIVITLIGAPIIGIGYVMDERNKKG